MRHSNNLMDLLDFYKNPNYNSNVDVGILGKRFKKENYFPNFILLVSFFLFTNFLFAQQPACNLTGVLETKTLNSGGTNFTITSEVINANPKTIYLWEFLSNTSQATFASENGKSSITINPGDQNGGVSLKLTVTNPSTSSESSKSCTCIKSISIGNP